MNAPARHRDDGRWLGAYAERVEVRCPRCDAPGTVRAQWASHRWNAVYVCAHCGLDARSEREDWLGAVYRWGRRPCGYCGHQWLHARQCLPNRGERMSTLPQQRVAAQTDTLPARCSVCGHESQVTLSAIRCVEQRDGWDPHFGLPLRLIEPTRAGLLWAYNAEHLAELRRYVAADQRERRGATHGKSMIARLPTWMKLARHRPLVLKALDRLHRQLDGVRPA
ncbi:hypothetical protein [Lysobacter silvisoli]|uniref:TFIIB-type zinc ribbon-containing protein n=1 Tax=Lysobacter silvisoli TaxID=2293254 RepID=A0A371K6E5_9GAMM|nr:hypothetical protein [Lysobacter silvisoli]RDZ29432.1 hypothetical protein DX914_10220 [Lysobacter silvisoli]